MNYADYADAFSSADLERAGRYYTDDCTLFLPSAPPMKGRDAILAFYGAMFRRVREHLTIHRFDEDADGITVDCTSTFTAIADAPDFVVKPLNAGESTSTHVIVRYTLRDGRFCRIEVTRAPG